MEATLKSWLFKKRVYMVTGVRVVSGARMTRSIAGSSSLSASGHAAIDGGQVLLGTEAKPASSSGDSEEVVLASDFVYGYRLNEVRYPGGKLTHRPYRGGEGAAADNSSVDVEPVNSIDDFEIIRIMDGPISGNAKNLKNWNVVLENDFTCHTLARAFIDVSCLCQYLYDFN